MIKTKKRIINRRKTFQSKRNLLRGGAEAGVGVRIDEVVHVAEFYMFNPPKDITCLGYYREIKPEEPKKVLNYKDIFPEPKPNEDEDLLFFTDEPSGRYSTGDNDDKKKRFLIGCFSYIDKVFKEGIKYLDGISGKKDPLGRKLKYFFRDLNMTLDNVKIETGINKYYLEQEKNVPNKMIKYSTFNGCYTSDCKVKLIPGNIYLCFLTKLNNQSNSVGNFINYFLDIDKNDFKSIFQYKCLLGRQDLNTKIQENKIFYNCFSQATWYYPSQRYLDLELSDNRYYDISKEQKTKDGELKTKKIENIRNTFNFLGKYLRHISESNPNKLMMVFLTSDRIVDHQFHKTESLNVYFGYEYFIRAINEKIQEESSGSVDQPSTSTIPLCNSESYNKSHYIRSKDVLNLVYDYDYNFHPETKILKSIYQRIKNEQYSYEDNMFLLSLSPRKIVKFLDKIINSTDFDYDYKKSIFFDVLYSMTDFKKQLLHDVDVFTKYLGKDRKKKFHTNQYLLNLINSYHTLLTLYPTGSEIKTKLMSIAILNPYICISNPKITTINEQILQNSEYVCLDETFVITAAKDSIFKKAKKVILKNFKPNGHIGFNSEKLEYLHLEISNSEFPKLPLATYHKLKELYIEFIDIGIAKAIDYYRNITSVSKILESLSLVNFQQEQTKNILIDVYTNLKKLYLSGCNTQYLIGHNIHNMDIILEDNIELDNIILTQPIQGLTIVNCNKINFTNCLFGTNFLDISGCGNIDLKSINVNVGLKLSDLQLEKLEFDDKSNQKIKYLKLNRIMSLSKLDLVNFRNLEVLVLKDIFSLKQITGKIPNKIRKLEIRNCDGLLLNNDNNNYTIIDNIIKLIIKNKGNEIYISKNIYKKLKVKSELINVV